MTTSTTVVREPSLLRLYVLRAAYLFIAAGLAVMIWPLLVDPPADLERMRSVVWALLGAVGALALLGIRYPLAMLPLLLFELLWKTIWIVAIGLPRRAAGTLDAGMQATWIDCVVGIVVVAIAIPWPWVFANYVRRPGDRWRREGSRGAVNRDVRSAGGPS